MKAPKADQGGKDAVPARKDAGTDENQLRRIFRMLLALIAFAWALANIDGVLHVLGKAQALLSPFLLGGAIAFLINVVMRPLENEWKK